ncbi:hypothetical protein J2855_005164, partial [Agrobacterium tumefaciens]|uniref:hypothetical protein n=1 Tax=Agrobacterium tumefaciens TaxID=358 RepID=UPI001AE80B3A
QALDQNLIRKPYSEVAHFSVEKPAHFCAEINSWEHINLTGIYTWDAEHQMPNGFRLLRLPARLQRVA